MDSRLVRRQPERLLGAVTAAPGSAEKSGVYDAGCGNGHVTPEMVLHSNFGCCIGTIKKS